MRKVEKLFEEFEQNLDEMESEEIAHQPQPEEDSGQESLTSEGELFYIEALVDAALYAPTQEERATLMNLQDTLKNKQYSSARNEVLPTALSIIQDTQDDVNLDSQLKDIQ